jgi:hypothetical protein
MRANQPPKEDSQPSKIALSGDRLVEPFLFPTTSLRLA